MPTHLRDTHDSIMSDLFYNVVAVIIFAFVAINFLFPCNVIIPLDRRTTSVLGAILCYLTRRFLFSDRPMDVLHSVDFDVMILLSSIMVINHLVVHLKETKDVIEYLQRLIRDDPVHGLWLISFAAFIASPFLTNDGVCLLFVEPILSAFDTAPFAAELVDVAPDPSGRLQIRKEDAMYFLLALACSANIGSALTYTGNPQNMIVASDSLEVLPSYKFLVYMLPAAIFSWFATMEYIRRCWMHARLQPDPMQLHSRHPSRGSAHSRKNSLGHVRSLSATSQRSGRSRSGSQSHSRRSSRADAVLPMHSRGASSGSQILQIETNALMTSDEAALSPPQEGPAFSPSAPSKPAAHRASFWDLKIFGGEGNMPKSPSRSALSPLSPRRRKAMERARLEKRINRLVTSPVPYVVLVLLAVMVVMIFIDVMPISGLICVFAISMVVVVVLGNHYMNKQIWTEEQEGEDEDEGALPPPASHSGVELQRLESGPSRATRQVESEDLGPLTYEDRLDNLNQFFEALFASIDYSLLIIFLGLFVVVENVASTGIPERVWAKIVGDAPFATAASITGISAFVLIVSQFLGNVAVIQLAKPNVEDLDDNTKRLAWAIISFVATIGGNLTITGSAANIIVAEKAARLDASMAIDFFRHFHVCFWITLVSCVVGAFIITAIGMADNATGSNW